MGAMHSSMIEFYKNIQNTLLPNQKEKNEQVKRKLISCELNLWSVILRMHEIYSKDDDSYFCYETKSEKEDAPFLLQQR